MSVPIDVRYNDFERQFVSIRDMNMDTQYIDRNGYVRSYCLLRQAASYLRLMQFEIVRTLFRRCCSENILTAKESIQRAFTAYMQPQVVSQLTLEARKQLLIATATKVNAVIDRINLARARSMREVLAPEAKCDLAAIERDWTQSAKEITRYRVNAPNVSEPAPAGPQPLLSSSLVLPSLSVLSAVNSAAAGNASSKGGGGKKQV